MRAALVALALLALAFAFARAPERAAAASFVVDTPADAVDAAPGDGLCATANGDCTLRAAIQEANALPGPDEIGFQLMTPGGPILSIEGRNEDAAATGDLDITGQLTIDGVVGPFENGVFAVGVDRVFDVRPGATVTLRGLAIRGGDAGDGDGGGVRNQGALTLDDVWVWQNTADDGGGINNTGTLALLSTAVFENTAEDVGGGIHNNGTLTLQGSAIRDNDGPFGGGGINNFGTLTVTRSTISGNTSASGRGGGVNNFASAGITNTTISGNEAHLSGGGIANSGDTFVLTSVTIAENTSDGLGGGLFSDTAGAVVRNTIFSANAGGNCHIAAPPQNEHHNLEVGSSCAFAGPGDLVVPDALIGPFQSAGYYLPLPGSPAIDAGDSATCPSTDQRNLMRPRDGDGDGLAVCDIGAIEFVPAVEALVGDVNCSGTVNAIDAALVLQYVAALLTVFPCAPPGPDANADGQINALDVALILQRVAGLIDSLPP